tara:strand:+ start:340 stop:753 length:414 start_codon:yes stop_codon:yes gene_type:complete
MIIKSSKTLVKEALTQITTLDASKAKELLEKNKYYLIDIRDIRELWNEGAIENAYHIPRGMLEFWLDPESPYYKKEKFGDSSKSFILFCAGGMRSALAAKSLKEMGYENIAHVDGGFAEMKVAGFKVVDLIKNKKKF